MALEANAVQDVPSISCLNLPFIHTRRLLGQGLSLSQGLYLYTGQYEHTHTHTHTHTHIYIYAHFPSAMRIHDLVSKSYEKLHAWSLWPALIISNRNSSLVYKYTHPFTTSTTAFRHCSQHPYLQTLTSWVLKKIKVLFFLDARWRRKECQYC